jgi:hypothetical protein
MRILRVIFLFRRLVGGPGGCCLRAEIRSELRSVDVFSSADALALRRRVEAAERRAEAAAEAARAAAEALRRLQLEVREGPSALSTSRPAARPRSSSRALK